MLTWKKKKKKKKISCRLLIQDGAPRCCGIAFTVEITSNSRLQMKFNSEQIQLFL